MLYFIAAVALCASVRGAEASLNTVKRIVTLHWNQTDLIYITIHLKKVSILMNLKIPCTACSDWQPSRMHVSIACFIALLLMQLLAKVKVEVFRVWPLACRWLALAIFCTGHGPLQFPAEVWRASRAFYTEAHNWPPLPTCTYWQWHKYAPLGEHIHIQEHTYAHKIICIRWHRPTLNWTHT